MFQVITAASGSYGCEVWATPFLHDWTVNTCRLQRYQASVYKRILGIPSSTSNLIAFFEMGRYPLQIDWLIRAVKYWNKRVTARDDNSLLSQLFMDNVHYGLAHEPPVKCWARELCDGLMLVNPDHDWEGCMRNFEHIAASQVAGYASHAFCTTIQCYNSDPTTDECMARQRCTYAQWMYLWGMQQPQANLHVPAYLTMTMMAYPTASARAQCALTTLWKMSTTSCWSVAV
jgi:hypothetical protein